MRNESSFLIGSDAHAHTENNLLEPTATYWTNGEVGGSMIPVISHDTSMI